MNQHLYHRRGFLGSAAFATALFTVRGAFADELTRTPPQTEGPFYPNKLPLDTDNDLIIVNEGITPAVGEITHLTGRILDAKGNPVAGAVPAAHDGPIQTRYYGGFTNASGIFSRPS